MADAQGLYGYQSDYNEEAPLATIEKGIAEGLYKRRPSIFMARAQSRIRVKLAVIHIERLLDITTKGAQAEGRYKTREEYLVDFDALNAKRGYTSALNPWLFVLKFSFSGESK